MEITNAKPGSDKYMMDWCDYVIGDLVKEKEHLFKAYNYFNGVRDHYQYKHLEENYGIGNPTSISFTPLTRKHIEALVGEYLSRIPKPKISCKDADTLHNIFREKQLEVASKQKQLISKYLTNQLWQAIADKGQDGKVPDDPQFEDELEEVKKSVERNFISQYEIAAQKIVKYILQDREIDFTNKQEQLMLDLLISGEAYYRTAPTLDGTNFKVEVCDPLNTWIDKDPKNRYMKNGYKSVVRKWMTPEEIRYKYGEQLSDEELKSIDDFDAYDQNESNFMLITGTSARCGGPIGNSNPGIWNDVGVHPLNFGYDRQWNLIPVYETEWIDSFKEKGKWKGKCFKCTRIGGDVYVIDDKNLAEMPVSLDAKNAPRLSINGIWYTNGHGSPYSLMLATADMQDNYDMLLYKKDNLIALSGTAGAIVDVSQLPEFLGDDLEERLIKFQGYRKVGLSIIDTSQEGSQQQNTFYGGFNDTQGLQSIQYIQLALEQIENTVSSITGVFRERLGGIEQRDAVANVEVGMQQSYIITKRYYNAMDTLTKEIISDCLDMAKQVYKEGLTGQLILGDRKEIFSILPKYYTTCSYDIQLADSAEIIRQQELLKQMAMQLIGSAQMDPEIFVILSTAESITEMKEAMIKNIQQRKMENNQLQQLQQALDQAQQTQKQMQQQLQQSTQKIAQLNEKKLDIEQQDNQVTQQIKWYEAQTKREYNMGQLELIKKRNELEAAQLLDDNLQNDEILDKKY